MNENDTLGTASPTRPAPQSAPAGPGDGVHGVPRGDDHPGDLRYADLDRLARLFRRVFRAIPLNRGDRDKYPIYDHHTSAAAGTELGRDDGGEYGTSNTQAIQGADGGADSVPNVPGRSQRGGLFLHPTETDTDTGAIPDTADGLRLVADGGGDGRGRETGLVQ